jgi:ABC-type transport system substrate-binding protein
MEMEKKNLAIIILAVVLAASGVGNIFLAMQAGLLQVTPPPLDQSLVFATIAGPTDMDPHMCYDTAGGDVISQIAECLYKFDTTDPSYPLLPVLATALPTVTGGGTELTIPLRQGVLFQDGTAFNSTVAKWNFDRLNYFMNISGNKFLDAPFNVPLLPSQQIAKHAALFTIAGMTIVNKTEIIDTYTIKITMNLEKASFVNLLNYEATSMQSMISARQQGKQFEILTYADDDVLIGTGPFKFQNYFTDIQVKF